VVSLLGGDGEERLDKVQPAPARRREVKVDARVALQPAPDLGVCVGSVVVRYEVQLPAGIGRGHESQERQELLMPVSLEDSVVDPTGRDLEVRNERAVEGHQQRASAVVSALIRYERRPGDGNSRLTRASAPAHDDMALWREGHDLLRLPDRARQGHGVIVPAGRLPTVGDVRPCFPQHLARSGPRAPRNWDAGTGHQPVVGSSLVHTFTREPPGSGAWHSRCKRALLLERTTGFEPATPTLAR
jgi:hypothetical protein